MDKGLHLVPAVFHDDQLDEFVASGRQIQATFSPRDNGLTVFTSHVSIKLPVASWAILSKADTWSKGESFSKLPQWRQYLYSSYEQSAHSVAS